LINSVAGKKKEHSLKMPRELHFRLEEIINSTEPGGRLPSEPKLAQILGVSRATLREAMRIFETQGRLRRQQGIGTFVLHPSQVIESGLEVLKSIEQLAQQIGLQVSMGELNTIQQKANDEMARKLDLKPGVELLKISRVMMADHRPAAFLVDILPVSILNYSDIQSDFSGSILDLLLERGDPELGNSRCEIGAVAANQDVAKALNIQRGASLLYFDSILFAKDGTPVDYALSYFLPGYFKFHVVRRVG
jgi:GntR family transcriptional regulator